MLYPPTQVLRLCGRKSRLEWRGYGMLDYIVVSALYVRTCSRDGLFPFHILGICSIFPCPDGTVCVPQSGGPPLCACPPGSTTPNCTIVDPCAADPCHNGANCTVVGVVDFECVCPAGATGENCTQGVAWSTLRVT